MRALAGMQCDCPKTPKEEQQLPKHLATSEMLNDRIHHDGGEVDGPIAMSDSRLAS